MNFPTPVRVYRTVLVPLVACVLFLAGGISSAQSVGVNGDDDPSRIFRPATVPVGVNAASIGFGGGGFSRTELPFSDMMKVCHGFDAVGQTDSYPGGASVVGYRQVFGNLDVNGYPLDVVPLNGMVYGTYIGRGIKGHYPSGTYLATFEGTGVIDFGGDVQSVTILSPNQYQLEVTPSNTGIVVRVLSSAGGVENVRNLRVVPEALSDAAGDPLQRFLPEYLDLLATLAPRAMRFHNWKYIVSGTVPLLAEEIPEEFYTYDRSVAGGGVPWSVIADLCELVGAELWVNIPYDADLEGYVRPLAQFLGDWSFATGLRVHIEYGSEVWNPTFAKQYCWILDDQQNCVPCDPTNPPPIDGTTQQCIAEFNVAHSLAIFAIFREEFGLRGIPTRAVRVLSGWAANSYYTSILLAEVQDSDAIDVFAIQTYFGSRTVAQLGWDQALAISIEDLANFLHLTVAGYPGGSLRRFMRINTNMLQALNDRLLPPDDIVLAAYEGGQSLTFDTCDCPGYCPSQSDSVCESQILSLSGKFNQLNRDPRMLDLYAHLFQVWDEFTADQNGVSGLWMQFTTVQEYGTAGQGSWGLLEYYDDPFQTAWKLLSLQFVQGG
ncbi:MAG: hypothetical protein ACI8QS_001666 [Planctomycetota bacterium]|jgi:hypothetical protein